MAITYLASGTASQNNGGTNPVPTLPAGCGISTMLICYIYSRATGAQTVSMPADWTQRVHDVTTGGLLAIFTKPWAFGDTDPTVTLSGFTGGASGDSVSAVIFGFNGVNRGAPIAQLGTVSTNASQANIGSISGITLASKASATVLVFGGRRDDGLGASVLTGDGLTWVEVRDAPVTAGADAHVVMAYAIDATGGAAVTAKTFTMSGVVNSEGKGIMIELAVATLGPRFRPH